MRTSEERVAELHHRMDNLKHAKHRRHLLAFTAACAACVVVMILMVSDISEVPNRTNNTVHTNAAVTASIFAGSSMLGYLAVIFAAFFLGILVTISCFRMKQHKEKEENRDDRKH